MLIDQDEEIGRTLKEARQHLGMKQRDLAKRIGTSVWALSRLENGKRRLEMEWLSKMPRAIRTAVRKVVSRKISGHMSPPPVETDSSKLEMAALPDD